MSQLDYYRDPRIQLPHQAGLAAWGVVLIVCGSLTGLFAVFMVLMAFVNFAGFAGMPRNMIGTMLSGAGVYVVIAIVLIWLGIGSRQGKRWVRPLMIVGSALTVASAVLSLFSLSVGVVGQLRHPTTPPAGAASLPFNPILIGFAMGGCFIVFIAIGLPVALLWFYGRPSVQATLNQMDPHSRWTEKCPLPVLACAISCVVFGVGFLFIIVKQIYPFFTAVLTGLPADAVAGTLAVALIVGGVLCYRLRPIGWLLTFATVTVLTASICTFAIGGDQQTYFDLLFRDIPNAQRQNLVNLKVTSLISPAIMYLGAMAYLLWIKKWFRAPLLGEQISHV